MIFRKDTWACVALACALSFSVVPAGLAQAPQSDDSASWSAPRGYDLAYPENGTPNMVARQGYAAGFNRARRTYREARHSALLRTRPMLTRRSRKGWTKISSRRSFVSHSLGAIQTRTRASRIHEIRVARTEGRFAVGLLRFSRNTDRS